MTGNPAAAASAALSQHLAFGHSGRVARNRFMKAAMSERLCSWVADPTSRYLCGSPTAELLRLYKTWARGDIGVIVTGNIMVDYGHLEAAGNPIIGVEDGFVGPRFGMFREWASECKAHGSLAIAQINHAGRQVKAIIEKSPISASDVQLPIKNRYSRPRAATAAELDEIVQAFAHAAEYLERAGFDGVEIHAAHGYLLAQFLSRVTNHRDDSYGGRIENRARLIVQIADEIRRRCSPRFVVAIKINAVDKGVSEAETRRLCEILDHKAFDFVEFSGGDYERLEFMVRESAAPNGRRTEAYFLEAAARMASVWHHSKTYVTGGFCSVEAMAGALNCVDGVGLARSLCLEPHLVRSLLQGETDRARAQKISPSDFSFSASVAGTQMWQMANGVEPIDLSSDDTARSFRQTYDGRRRGKIQDSAKLA